MSKLVSVNAFCSLNQTKMEVQGTKRGKGTGFEQPAEKREFPDLQSTEVLPDEPVSLVSHGFLMNMEAVQEYVKKVNESEKEFSLATEREVFAPFLVPASACIFWKKYTFLQRLGSGQFGVVLSFVHNGKEYAVKFQAFNQTSEGTFHHLATEVAINVLLTRLDPHNSIGTVRMFDWARCIFKFQGRVRLARLRMGGDLAEHEHAWQLMVLQKGVGTFRSEFQRIWANEPTEKVLKYWTASVLQILCHQLYLQRAIDFLHFDLHSANILAVPKENVIGNKRNLFFLIEGLPGGGGPPWTRFVVPLADTEDRVLQLSDFGRSFARYKTVLGAKQELGRTLRTEDYLNDMELDFYYATTTATSLLSRLSGPDHTSMARFLNDMDTILRVYYAGRKKEPQTRVNINGLLTATPIFAPYRLDFYAVNEKTDYTVTIKDQKLESISLITGQRSKP